MPSLERGSGAAQKVVIPFQGQLLNRIAAAETELNEGGNSQGFLLLGEPGVGKTFVLDELAARYQSTIDSNQRITPLVRLAPKPGAGFESICADMLERLGMSRTAVERVKPKFLERALFDALVRHRVQTVVLEELHNALTREGKQLRSRLTDFLKNLWNFYPTTTDCNWASSSPGLEQRKLLIIVSGKPELEAVFATDKELQSRYNNIVRAPRLSIRTADEFRAFREMVVHFSHRFPVAAAFDAASDDFAIRCYLATNAHMRHLEKLFERARTLARTRPWDEGNAYSIFSAAYDEVVPDKQRKVEPFSATTEQVHHEFGLELMRQNVAPGIK